MFGCYTCTVPILTTVLTETQRPSKCPRTPPTVLIYRRHLSREFWVMDLDLDKQKSRTKYISEFKVQDVRHVPFVKWGVTLGTFKGRIVSFYYNLMHLIVVKSISNQGKLFNFKSLSFTFTTYIPTCGSFGSPDSKIQVLSFILNYINLHFYSSGDYNIFKFYNLKCTPDFFSVKTFPSVLLFNESKIKYDFVK